MPPQSKFLDRNDIARILDCSVDVVSNNEQRWGITPHRVNFNSRMVRFHATATLAQLRKMGMIIDGTQR